MREVLRREHPAFLVADTYYLDLDRPWHDTLNGGRLGLLAEDYAVLRDNFVRHWGAIYVPGKRVDFPAGEAEKDVEILIPGVYTLEGDGGVADRRGPRPTGANGAAGERPDHDLASEDSHDGRASLGEPPPDAVGPAAPRAALQTDTTGDRDNFGLQMSAAGDGRTETADDRSVGEGTGMVIERRATSGLEPETRRAQRRTRTFCWPGCASRPGSPHLASGRAPHASCRAVSGHFPSTRRRSCTRRSWPSRGPAFRSGSSTSGSVRARNSRTPATISGPSDGDCCCTPRPVLPISRASGVACPRRSRR